MDERPRPWSRWALLLVLLGCALFTMSALLRAPTQSYAPGDEYIDHQGAADDLTWVGTWSVVFCGLCVLCLVAVALRPRTVEGTQALWMALAGTAASLLWTLTTLFDSMPPTSCGRPLRDRRGRARRASCAGGEIRSEAWLDVARDEHASIAAFARIALELMTHGAPLELIRRVQQAASDEIAHTELCLRMASGEGPLPALGRIPSEACVPVPSLDRIAREALLDGCIGEAVAAERARVAALEATRPDARAAWARIADDEARHGELGWAILAFCLPRCAATTARDLEALCERAGGMPSASTGHPDLPPEPPIRARVSATALARLRALTSQREAA